MILQGKRMKSFLLPPAGGVLPAELFFCCDLGLKLRFKILRYNNLPQINLRKLLYLKIY